MKRLFRKIRSVYRKNPPAYLSLAVIAISLTIGTSVSNLGLTAQILRIEGRSQNCSRFRKMSGCRSRPHCSWLPGERKPCRFNASGKCPAGCQYTPAQTLNCSDIKQKQACSPPCRWRSQTTRGECLEEIPKPCSLQDCNANKKGCWFKNTSSCSCSRWKNDFQGCKKNDCDWVKQTTCAGQTTTCAKYQTTKQGSCSGSTQQISQAKCGGEFYYTNARCVTRSTTPSPSSSCDLPCQEYNPRGTCIIDDEGQPMCVIGDEPTTAGTPCDPSKKTIGSDGLLYSECSPNDPLYFCQPDSYSPKGGYCQRRDDHPFLYNPQSECNPFAQLYGSDSPTTHCDSVAYDCVLKPGTDDFYICLSTFVGVNQCDPNNVTHHPELGTINEDCYVRHRDENMVCARLPKPNNRLYTCQSSTSDETLKPCYYEEYDRKWYAHGSTISQQNETCNIVDGLPTGFEVRSQLCSNGEWKDKDVTYVDSDDCPQVASCKMYDLNNSAQRKLFKEGSLHCCGKVVNYLDTKNNYGQTYRDYYNAICKPKEESKTSFWESLKEIF